MRRWFEKKPIIALAPMADITDSPFCRLCREISTANAGQAGKDFIIFREMVSAEAIVRGNEKTLRMCAFDEIERPIVIQIFGSVPKRMAEAAKIIMDKFHPDGIDVNMGCPVPKIAGRSLAGASLMKNPERAGEIVGELRAANLGAPISVKTRLGWSDPKEILSFAAVLEEAGAEVLTIHGRTKIQGYTGAADWQTIGEVKKKIKIPIIANGDIKSAEDIKKCLEITKADGVMIGRGALGNPWIFETQSEKRKIQINKEEMIRTVLRHAELHLERYGEKGIITLRKHLGWYFKGDRPQGLNNLKKIRSELMTVNSLQELKNILDASLSQEAQL